MLITSPPLLLPFLPLLSILSMYLFICLSHTSFGFRLALFPSLPFTFLPHLTCLFTCLYISLCLSLSAIRFSRVVLLPHLPSYGSSSFQFLPIFFFLPLLSLFSPFFSLNCFPFLPFPFSCFPIFLSPGSFSPVVFSSLLLSSGCLSFLSLFPSYLHSFLPSSAFLSFPFLFLSYLPHSYFFLFHLSFLPSFLICFSLFSFPLLFFPIFLSSLICLLRLPFPFPLLSYLPHFCFFVFHLSSLISFPLLPFFLPFLPIFLVPSWLCFSLSLPPAYPPVSPRVSSPLVLVADVGM